MLIPSLAEQALPLDQRSVAGALLVGHCIASLGAGEERVVVYRFRYCLDATGVAEVLCYRLFGYVDCSPLV